jgi:hypothetical protein
MGQAISIPQDLRKLKLVLLLGINVCLSGANRMAFAFSPAPADN